MTPQNNLGNDLSTDPLMGLRDYHLPDPPGALPAPLDGWLLAVLPILLVLLWGWRRWRRQTAYRQALRELGQLRQRLLSESQSPDWLQALSRLLRRYVIQRFPEQSVAALTGQAWLAFLEQHADPAIRQDAIRYQLLQAPYRATPCNNPDALLSWVEHWIRHNRNSPL